MKSFSLGAMLLWMAFLCICCAACVAFLPTVVAVALLIWFGGTIIAELLFTPTAAFVYSICYGSVIVTTINLLARVAIVKPTLAGGRTPHIGMDFVFGLVFGCLGGAFVWEVTSIVARWIAKFTGQRSSDR